MTKKLTAALALSLLAAFFCSIGNAADCKMLLAKDFYPDYFQRNLEDVVDYTLEENESPSESDKRLMKKLIRQGAVGHFAKTKHGNGIALTVLPKHFSPEIKQRYAELMQNNIHAVIGKDMQIPWFVGAAIMISEHFTNAASGMIMLRPEFFTQLLFNHEVQHAYDYIISANKFFDEMPAAPAASVAALKRAEGGANLSRRGKWQAKAAERFPKIWAEAKASEQSVKNFFCAKGIKEMVLPKGRSKEIFAAFNEIHNVAYRNAQLAFYQTLIDPRTPRSLVFAAKAAASGYVAIQSQLIIFDQLFSCIL